MDKKLFADLKQSLNETAEHARRKKRLADNHFAAPAAKNAERGYYRRAEANKCVPSCLCPIFECVG